MVVLLLTILVGCTGEHGRPSANEAHSATNPVASTPPGPKGTLRIAWGAEPPTLAPKIASGGSTALTEVSIALNSALTYRTPTGENLPQIAAEVPTLESGAWVVNADGTMVTTYRLRPNARWHDGRPLTAADFAFAFEVYSDPEVPVARRAPENAMAAIDASDDQRLTIHWKRPYHGANALRYQQLDPLPRHLLEERYRADKATFLQGSLWTTDYVGSGPFQLERWEPGVGLVARAFSAWVLGPPRLARLEIRFIPDSNTILANLLAGEIDVSGLPWIGPAQAASIRDRWVDGGMGYIKATESRLQHMDFQFRQVPSWQPALADVRVRQALVYGLNRAGLVELMNQGLGGSVANTFVVLPTESVFREVERATTRYPFDPTRAADC